MFFYKLIYFSSVISPNAQSKPKTLFCNNNNNNNNAGYLAPRQLGFGSLGGCEAAVHAARRFINYMPSDFVVAKLDFSNAFNCLHRDVMLTAVKDQLPELYKFCHLAYLQTSFLNFGPYTILSQEVPQQGNP